MFGLTFQIFCHLYFSLKDFIKIDRLVLSAVSINGLTQLCVFQVLRRNTMQL